MKILHFNNEKTWRGGERQTLLLAQELRHLGIENAIACRRGAPLSKRAGDSGVRVIEVPGSSLGALAAVRHVSKEFDLIHCHTGRGHSIAALGMVGTSKPFIVTRRVDFEPRQTIFNHWKFRRAARVVCISQFIAKQLERWGVQKSLLEVVPDCGAGIPGYGSAKKSLHELLPEVVGKKIVGNIAAMVPHKDQATLLRAAQVVAERRKDVIFVIVGDGELRKDLEALRRQLGLEKTVLMPGFVPNAEKLLPSFDVLAMSSCMEGLGSIVIDAFFTGVPVAATAGGGLPELVANDGTGLLAAVKDFRGLAGNIMELLDNGMLSQRLVAAAKKLAEEKFTVQAMASRYEGIYRELVAR